MRHFIVYGLTIASEFNLLAPVTCCATAPDVTISAAPSDFFGPFRGSEEAGTAPKMCRYEPQPDGSSYVSWYARWDFFISSDGRTILCGSRDDACLEAYIGFLLSFVLSFSLLRMGEEVLHATVVEFGQQTIGLLGPSGAGKSTLASYCLSRGARLVTDDMLRVTFEDQSVIAHPGPPRIKLLPESAALFSKGASCDAFVNPFTEKEIIVPPDAQRADRGLPLKAFYVLDCQESFLDRNSIRLEKLKSAQAALSLLGSTFNGAVQTPERLETQFRIAARIASVIPVFRLSYPRRFDALISVYERVAFGDRQYAMSKPVSVAADSHACDSLEKAD